MATPEEIIRQRNAARSAEQERAEKAKRAAFDNRWRQVELEIKQAIKRLDVKGWPDGIIVNFDEDYVFKRPFKRKSYVHTRTVGRAAEFVLRIREESWPEAEFSPQEDIYMTSDGRLVTVFAANRNSANNRGYLLIPAVDNLQFLHQLTEALKQIGR